MVLWQANSSVCRNGVAVMSVCLMLSGMTLGFVQTAEILRGKRKEIHEVSLAVNKTKLEIDRVRSRLERWEEARLVTSGWAMVGRLEESLCESLVCAGDPRTHGGQPVLEEEEYLDIVELKKVGAIHAAGLTPHSSASSSVASLYS